MHPKDRLDTKHVCRSICFVPLGTCGALASSEPKQQMLKPRPAPKRPYHKVDLTDADKDFDKDNEYTRKRSRHVFCAAEPPVLEPSSPSASPQTAETTDLEREINHAMEAIKSVWDVVQSLATPGKRFCVRVMDLADTTAERVALLRMLIRTIPRQDTHVYLVRWLELQLTAVDKLLKKL